MIRIVLLSLLALPALACETPGPHRAEGGGVTIGFATTPARIVVGEPFELEMTACTAGSALRDGPRVDAWMPAHRHGMNYRTRVTALGDGRFRVTGLVFHMPGRWELLFDLPTGRVTAPFDLE